MEGSPGYIFLCSCDQYIYREMYYMHDESMAHAAPLVVVPNVLVNLLQLF